nr:MAG TPA: restriction endonuclease [Crassvirales sp.]
MCTKKCCICKLEKSITEFYSQKTHKDGLMSMCKSCFN